MRVALESLIFVASSGLGGNREAKSTSWFEVRLQLSIFDLGIRIPKFTFDFPPAQSEINEHQSSLVMISDLQ